MTNHFLEVDNLGNGGLDDVLNAASNLKEEGRGNPLGHHLQDRTLAMLFEKPSTRTRVSFETGMTQLGGHAVFLGPEDTQLSRGEPVKDTVRTLSGYVDAITARVYDHSSLVEMAEYASVPVVNALSDRAHPCQTLGDLLTLREVFGDLGGVTAAWVGDGNNVARSFAVGCAMAGVDLRVATPERYGLDEEVVERAKAVGDGFEQTTDPTEAVDGADVVYTDVFVSMGEEDKRDEKLEAFEGFQVGEELLSSVPDAKVMHCLPAHRGEEITDGVLEGDRSVVWRQAENRMYAQKALLWRLVD